MDATSSRQRMRKFDANHASGIVMDLLTSEKRKIAFEILDMYYMHAETLSDFDILGGLALKAEHRQLYLKCAEAAYTKAETSEQLYIARSNLYKAYNALNYPEKALFYIGLNLKVTPDDFETQTQRAFNLALQGNRRESEDILSGLAVKFPDRAKDLKSAFSGKMLRNGNTAEGILSFIETFKPKNVLFDDVLKMKRWDGIPRPGKTIYVDGEGGIGDEIINIRFFKHLEDLGMKPILYSAWSEYRKDTIEFFKRNGFEVTTDKITVDRTQLWVPMMSLPGYLNLTENQLWYGPYLTPQRKNQLKFPNVKLKIGIKCSGNPYFSQDEYRKIDIDKMLEYLPIDNNQVCVYYIDKQPLSDLKFPVVDLSPNIKSWEDTLDIIDQMDVIVSSCTSLVHAAGAMGKETHVIVPIAEYYIWSTTSKTTRSPWYGENFHVHKQTKVRSWDEPLQEVSIVLNKLIEK
jgi:hypothetical protein